MNNSYFIKDFIAELKKILSDSEKYFLTSSTVPLSLHSKLSHEIISQDLANFFLGEDISSEIIFSTASLQLIEKKEIYDPLKTVCKDRGLLNEIMRKRCSVRSNHPFISYGGIRTSIDNFLSYDSPHAYGLNTITDYLYKNNFCALCIGIDPRINILVHHAEHLASVPYRYTKELDTKQYIRSKYIYK